MRGFWALLMGSMFIGLTMVILSSAKVVKTIQKEEEFEDYFFLEVKNES